MTTLRRYLSLFLILVCASCTRDVGYTNPGEYPAEIGSILLTKCAVSGCHNTASHSAANNLDLSSWSLMFEGSRNGSPVIPFNSRYSSLCYFINTFPELGTKNTPTMPLNKPPLPFEDVKKIKNWIDAGASNSKGGVRWADNPRRAKLYAVNQGCDVVTVFDAETGLPMRFVPVGTKPGPDTPHHIRVSPDGDYWYVIFINNNIMQKFRCSDDSHVGDIPLTPFAAGTGPDDASDWNTFVIAPDGKRAYCVSWTQNGSIASVDLEKMKFIRLLGGQHYPHAVALNGNADKLYVGAQTGNFISEMDTSLTESPVRYSLGGTIVETPMLDAHDILLSPDKVHLWITCQRSNDVRVFNTVTHQVEKVIPTGVYPQEIVYSSSTNEYFVSCTNDSVTIHGASGVVSRIGANANQASHAAVGHQPHGLAVDETRRLLYVLSRNITGGGTLPHHSAQCAGRNGFVNFVDLNSFTVQDRKYELSVDPYFIYARP